MQVCSNMWAPTAGLLQCLTVLQQCVHQKSLGMFVKSEVTGRACIGLEQNIIDTAVTIRHVWFSKYDFSSVFDSFWIKTLFMVWFLPFFKTAFFLCFVSSYV